MEHNGRRETEIIKSKTWNSFSITLRINQTKLKLTKLTQLRSKYNRINQTKKKRKLSYGEGTENRNRGKEQQLRILKKEDEGKRDKSAIEHCANSNIIATNSQGKVGSNIRLLA